MLADLNGFLAPYRLEALLELVVDVQRQELGALWRLVDEELEVGLDLLLEVLVLLERVDEEVIEAVLELDEVLNCHVSTT